MIGFFNIGYLLISSGNSNQNLFLYIAKVLEFDIMKNKILYKGNFSPR